MHPVLALVVRITLPLEDSLLRYGLGQLSLVAAWAVGAEARATAVGAAEDEAIPPSGFGFRSDDPDWE